MRYRPALVTTLTIRPFEALACGIPLISTPWNDVEGLFRHVRRMAPRYAEISAPTVVISGDYDTVVYEEIHSIGLARDIPGAELVWVKNLGHKPDWIAPELAVAAIESVAGKAVDLQEMAREVEARIAGDRFGADCANEKAPGGELAPV